MKKKLSAMDYAVYLLSLNLQSTGQLREKMLKKGYGAEDINAVIQRLTDLHYLNDDQFAQIYFENLKKYKQLGYFGIRRKLIEKKISQSVVAKLMSSLTTAEELAIAKRLVAKRPQWVSGPQMPKDKKLWQRQVRSLQSKGFRTDVIMKALKLKQDLL